MRAEGGGARRLRAPLLVGAVAAAVVALAGNVSRVGTSPYIPDVDGELARRLQTRDLSWMDRGVVVDRFYHAPVVRDLVVKRRRGALCVGVRDTKTRGRAAGRCGFAVSRRRPIDWAITRNELGVEVYGVIARHLGGVDVHLSDGRTVSDRPESDWRRFPVEFFVSDLPPQARVHGLQLVHAGGGYGRFLVIGPAPRPAAPAVGEEPERRSERGVVEVVARGRAAGGWHVEVFRDGARACARLVRRTDGVESNRVCADPAVLREHAPIASTDSEPHGVTFGLAHPSVKVVQAVVGSTHAARPHPPRDERLGVHVFVINYGRGQLRFLRPVLDLDQPLLIPGPAPD